MKALSAQKQISAMFKILQNNLLNFIEKHLFVYFWPCGVFVAVHRLFRVAVSGACFLVVGCGLLIAVASLGFSMCSVVDNVSLNQEYESYIIMI